MYRGLTIVDNGRGNPPRTNNAEATYEMKKWDVLKDNASLYATNNLKYEKNISHIGQKNYILKYKHYLWKL